MRRRALLRTGATAGVALTLPRTVAASSGDASAQTGYEPLGRVAVDGAAEVVVGDDGDTAYLATTTGFATVDVSDPADPTVLATEDGIAVDDAPLTQILDVKVDGNRLVVPGPANQSSDRVFHGFVRYDVSDPADPEPVGDPYETGFHIHNCYLEDDLLFVVANGRDENPLVVYDVGDEVVEEIGRWSLVDHEPGWGDVHWLARYLHDVVVHDNVAYLSHWDAGTYLLDVSYPAEPEYVSHVSETALEEQRGIESRDEAQRGLPGNDHFATVDEAGDLLAVGRESWATGGDEPDGPGGIDLYDVTDPESPSHRATIEAPEAADESYYGGLWTTSHNFELRDGELYSSWYQGGVKIHDVSDPAEPEELAWWRDPGETGFWTARVAQSGETFVASSTPIIPSTDLEGALYTFPIAAGEQADPPSLTDLPGRDDGGANETADGDGGNGSDENGTGDGSDGDGDDASDGDDATPSLGPGGIAGVAGGAIALEWLRRRNRR